MDTQKISSILKNPQQIQLADVSILDEVIKEYPYFQAARAVQLKALKDQKSFSYNDKLKQTAAYTVDRGILFDFITSTFFKETISVAAETNKETTEEKIETQQNVENTKKPVENSSEKITTSKETPNEIAATTTIIPREVSLDITSVEADQITDPYLFEEKDQTPYTKAITNIPLEFNKNETHSFAEWLRLASMQPIIRDEISVKSSKKRLIESDLIDKFILNSPKISPVNKTIPNINLAKQSNITSENLMTETLAKVYLAQKNYKKAIQAYKILILKNPEKSGLFADQIRAIEKLTDNKQ